MSTRSIVAAETEKGIIGVYVHFDGSPSSRLHVLRTLVARDGISKVVAALVGTPNGWSTIDPSTDPAEALEGSQADGRFAKIAGYGTQYTTTRCRFAPEGQADTEYWTPDSDPETYWDSEFLYIIRTNSTVDWAANEGPYSKLTWTNETLVS